MVPAGNKAKRLSSVNHTTKTIYHHHHNHHWIFLGVFPHHFFEGQVLCNVTQKIFPSNQNTRRNDPIFTRVILMRCDFM